MNKPRVERFEMVYINSAGVEKRCYPKSKQKRDDNLKFAKEHNIKVVSCRKLYPFATINNQHNFELIANITFNAMKDMESGKTEWNDDEYERLEKTHEKANEFFCMDLPVVYVPWGTYCEMREMAAAAELHRDSAVARAIAEREEEKLRIGLGSHWHRIKEGQT